MVPHMFAFVYAVSMSTGVLSVSSRRAPPVALWYKVPCARSISLLELIGDGPPDHQQSVYREDDHPRRTFYDEQRGEGGLGRMTRDETIDGAAKEERVAAAGWME